MANAAKNPQRNRIVVVDDHPLTLAAITTLLERLMPDCEIRAEHSCDDAIRTISDGKVSLVLTDLRADGFGESSLAELIAAAATIPVMVVSANDDPATIRDALAMGARGFVLKSAGIEIFRAAIGLVLSGGVYVPQQALVQSYRAPTPTGTRDYALTPRQIDVLRELSTGLSNKAIAQRLGLSIPTVKLHMQGIMRALGANNRTDAVLRAKVLKIALSPYPKKSPDPKKSPASQKSPDPKKSMSRQKVANSD